MKLMALIADTFREIYAKKVIIGIIVIEIVTLAITALVLFSPGMQRMYREAGTPVPIATPDSARSEERTPGVAPEDAGLLAGGDSLPITTYADTGRTAPSRTLETAPPVIDGQEMGATMESRSVKEMVMGEMGMYAAPIAFATIFLGIFATAGIIPSMMEKGAIDLLLSKPLPRAFLLLGRALGGILAIAINSAIFVTLLWALYGLASGIWYIPFLIYTFAIPLFTFLVIYSGILALNVFTESWILPMSLAYIHLMVLANVLFGREATLFTFISSPVLQGIIDGVYYILPQTADLIGAVPSAIFSGSLDSMGPFIQGTIFAVAMTALAVWKFERKDF